MRIILIYSNKHFYHRYSYWEFDTKENYGKAIKFFFENYNKELRKLLIAPFDINLGYSI